MRRIELWEKAPGFNPAFGQEAPGLNLFLLDDGQPHGLVIVFPGGGYNGLAPHEGAPIAKWLNAAGFSAGVLNYRVAPYRHPVPFQDAARAVRTVRAHAAEWGVRAEKIGVLGFSAGGHLAATLATQFDAGDPRGLGPDRAGQFAPGRGGIVLRGGYLHRALLQCRVGPEPGG